MFLKLGIIAAILIVGGLVFANEIDTLFPVTTAAVSDSLNTDATNLGTSAIDSAKKRIDASIDKIVDKTNRSLSNQVDNGVDKAKDKISDVKESSQKTFDEQISSLNPFVSIPKLFGCN